MVQTYRRRFPRVEADFPVRYTLSGPEREATALTLGGGGMFLELREAVEPGDVLALRFRPARRLPLIKAKARVCYYFPNRRAGLEFTEISPAHRDQILRLIFRRRVENRHYPRGPLATQVEHAAGSFIGFSKDVSAGGMFIETRETLPLGSALKVRFRLGETDPICLASAEVRYEIRKVGMGVEFTDISAGDQERIEGYLASVPA
jgi:c-di-GMP-binding flagellar brake protein YcgR